MTYAAFPHIATLIAEQTDVASQEEPTVPSEDAFSGPEVIDMRSITVISKQLPVIEVAKTRIHAEMEHMVLTGLEMLVSTSAFVLTTKLSSMGSLSRISLFWHLLYKRRST